MDCEALAAAVEIAAATRAAWRSRMHGRAGLVGSLAASNKETVRNSVVTSVEEASSRASFAEEIERTGWRTEEHWDTVDGCSSQLQQHPGRFAWQRGL